MVAQKTQEIQRRKNSPKEILRTKVMKTLFCSAYLAPVEYYARWVQAEAPLLEVHENYQKQPIRSRTCIGGANGPLTLNIPVEHPGEAIGHQKMNQARTVTEFRWARQHFRSLETAYRTSPYFEYYEDLFRDLYFEEEPVGLLDFNLRAHRLVCHLLGIEENPATTSCYEDSPADTLDLRKAFSPKKESLAEFPAYTQVFDDRFGFQPNLSIVDLLFCCGPDSLQYLKDVKLPPL